MRPLKPLRPHTAASQTSAGAPPRQLLSKSMEKTFRRLSSSLDERDAYVQAEVATALAHQIRAIRMQRGWTQAELAQRMGTRQHVVSRLEDPSYGRYTVQTLMQLSRAFDTGLQVRFVSFVTMFKDSFLPSHAHRAVSSFDEEAGAVEFECEPEAGPGELRPMVAVG